jgi:hypothetical protein
MSVRGINILSIDETNPINCTIELVYSTGKKEKMSYVPIRDLIRLYKGNSIPLPAEIAKYNKQTSNSTGDEIISRKKINRDEDTIITISNVAKTSGKNNYCTATLTYKYGDEKNVTVTIEELESMYNNNFMFIPDSVQRMFDQYYAKNSVYSFADDVREKDFLL